MSMRAAIAYGLTLAFVGAGAAFAHSPYLLPNTFDASTRDHVTIQGAITEHYFIPEFALKSDVFHAVGPDGARIDLKPISGRDLTLLELPMTVDGTWRVSSGLSPGRSGKAVLVAGEWKPLNPRSPPAEGAVVADLQSFNRADVYVSRGAPNAAALKPTGEGLEFQPITHPDKISVDEPARFVLLLDGQPLAGQTIKLIRGDDLYAEGKPDADVVTDAKGGFTLTAKTPGVYYAMARYRQLPAKTGEALKAYTYALTFEAVR